MRYDTIRLIAVEAANKLLDCSADSTYTEPANLPVLMCRPQKNDSCKQVYTSARMQNRERQMEANIRNENESGVNWFTTAIFSHLTIAHLQKDAILRSWHFPTAMTRKTIQFFGNVQGVGFRYTACSIAGGFEVSGFVRNLRGGSVEMVVEGNATEIERFLNTLRDRMEGHIDREEMTDTSATGEFAGFGIR